MLKAVTAIVTVASSSWLWQQAVAQIRDPVCLAVFGPPIPNPHPISPSRFQHQLRGYIYYYFALANTSNEIRFQTFVAKTELADVLLHISSSLPSFTATYANLTLTLTLTHRFTFHLLFLHLMLTMQI